MVISTKLPIVKDLIVHRFTRRIRRKAETHVKLFDTCKELQKT
jgi:hypothetical protein